MDLPGPEIGRRRKAGEPLFYTHEALELAYATATLPEVLDQALGGAAPAQPGEHCGFCGVRAFCADYWKEPLNGDIELVVSEMPSAHCVGDGETTVLLRSGHAAVSKIKVGERVRCLGVQAGDEALDLAPWGEVFVTTE